MDKKGKHVILLNPSSGRNRAIRFKKNLENLLVKNKINYEILVTKSEENLRELVKKKVSEAKSLVAAGGDSTFTILVNELIKLKKKIPLGIIPLGSSDDIALEYNIKNPEDAVKAIAGQKTRIADVGEIKSRGNFVYYFPGQANIGIGAWVNKYVALQSGNQTLAGIKAIFLAFKNRRVPADFKIRFDKNNISGKFTGLLFSKIKYWSGGRLFLPGARLDDSKIHVLSIGELSEKGIIKGFLNTLKIMVKAQSGKHIDNNKVMAYMSEGYSISSSHPFIIQVDGDIIKDGRKKNKDKEFKKIKINILKKRIEVFFNPE